MISAVSCVWILIFGHSKRILSDNAREFSNEEFQEMKENMNIRRLINMAAESSGTINGRHNVILIDMVIKIKEEAKYSQMIDWLEQSPLKRHELTCIVILQISTYFVRILISCLFFIVNLLSLTTHWNLKFFLANKICFTRLAQFLLTNEWIQRVFRVKQETLQHKYYILFSLKEMVG